jgi:hypothetical protein
MPKTRPPYSPEFRRQMIELVRAAEIRPSLPGSLNRPPVDQPLGGASRPAGGPPGGEGQRAFCG